MLSESVVYLALCAWHNKPWGADAVKGVTTADITRVCREFVAVSAVWSKLGVGESMTLAWRGEGKVKRHRSRR
jgi:hypothetical protein